MFWLPNFKIHVVIIDSFDDMIRVYATDDRIIDWLLYQQSALF